MIKLEDLSLNDLLNANITNNEDIKYLAEALSLELQNITKDIDRLLILVDIDNQNEETIDLLAWQFHVDFYEPLGMDLEKKKKLVKNSLKTHRQKGTKAAIFNMISILYTEKCKISEWFEFDGDPYTFRINIENESVSAEDMKNIMKIVDEYKSCRSHLEKIVFNKFTDLSLFAGFVGKKKTIFSIPYVNSENSAFVNTHIGLVIKSKKKFSIKV